MSQAYVKVFDVNLKYRPCAHDGAARCVEAKKRNEVTMIEEVVNSILQAEDTAKQRIQQAENKAAEIINAAEIAAEQIKKQAVADNKAFVAEQGKAIDDEVKAQAEAFLQQRSAEVDNEIKHYQRNVDKAVKLILESV